MRMKSLRVSVIKMAKKRKFIKGLFFKMTSLDSLVPIKYTPKTFSYKRNFRFLTMISRIYKF